MSFNNTFNKSGFTLPSFTNVQPTVGISEVKTSGGLENEDPNKNSDNKSNRNYAETVMETLLEDLKSDGNGTQNAGTPASCSQENGWQDKIEQASNSDNLNLLTPGTNNVETNKSERPNFEDELYEDVKSSHDIEGRETLQLGNEVDDTRISESKQSSNKDSLADTEKVGLASKEIKRGDTGQSESNEEMEMEKGYEKLSSLPLEEESDDCISIDEKAEVPVEEEPVPQEDSMQNPQDNIPESVEDARIADEITNELEIRRTSRKNSIKDIPNPPSNLRKQQAFDFQTFLVQFKSAKCQPVHKYLKSFLSQFNQRTWSIEEQVKLVHEFEEFLYEKLRECMEIENSKEGIEKLVMTRVYNSVFSPVMPYLKLTETNKHDRVMDRKFLLNVHIYEWIEPKNLDLCLNIEKEPMERASEQLMKIDDFKSPRDKIVCILNACKIIFGMIREQESEENADSFVPLLIYVLIQCKLKHLYSNLQYIERFRNSEFLVGETSYYVSTLQIACNFIIGMNRDQLTVEEEEYERQVALARDRIRELQGTRGDIPSQVLTKSAEMVRQTISQLLTHTNDNEVDNDNNNNNQEVQHQRESSAISDAVAQSVLEAQEHAQKVQTLAEIGSMFPYLEGEIVASVFAACNDNAEQTVDALLEMA